MEVWKSIKDYDGIYEISNLGRVKSLKRIVKKEIYNINVSEKILKQTLNINKYLMVSLNKNGIKKNVKVHLLVAESFLNHKTDSTNKIVVDNIDNDKTNNKLENIQLITNRENCSKENRGFSKYTGVGYAKRDKKWRAYICINNKFIHLGYFKSEIEAHNCYQNKLKNIQQ